MSAGSCSVADSRKSSLGYGLHLNTATHELEENGGIRRGLDENQEPFR